MGEWAGKMRDMNVEERIAELEAKVAELLVALFLSPGQLGSYHF